MPVAGEQVPVVIRVLYCVLELPQCVSSYISMLLSTIPIDVPQDTSRYSGLVDSDLVKLLSPATSFHLSQCIKDAKIV